MRALGRDGEERAVQYLKKRGYQILERNYFTRYGEIDIVAKKKGVNVFVEVKSNRSWNAEYSFTPYKAKRVYKAAMIYLSSKNLCESPYRFDLIAINGEDIVHYENILEEGGVIG
ncbi:MAG: YraN family protein [Synergistetes bacterium]|nr:YraN family protein [Synergistota bacterium]